MDMRTQRLVVLGREECLTLLRTHPVHVGRLGIADADGQPLVVPVNYRLDGDAVVLRTTPGSLIARHAAGRRVAFEVDDVDPNWEEGWSVLLQGDAELVGEEAERDRLARLGLRSWAPGDRCVYLRLVPMFLSGRRIL